MSECVKAVTKNSSCFPNLGWIIRYILSRVVFQVMYDTPENFLRQTILQALPPVVTYGLLEHRFPIECLAAERHGVGGELCYDNGQKPIISISIPDNI